jgi:hypothetical protein
MIIAKEYTMKSLKQVPTILDYIDRSIFRNEYNDTGLPLYSIIIGAGGVRISLDSKTDMTFDPYWYSKPITTPVRIFDQPFAIIGANMDGEAGMVYPDGHTRGNIYYYCDEQFFDDLFVKQSIPELSNYLIIGGHRGRCNMFVSHDNLADELGKLYNRIIERIKDNGMRARKKADKSKTYKEIEYKYPRNQADILHQVAYHKMTPEDILCWWMFLPAPITPKEISIRQLLIDLSKDALE